MITGRTLPGPTTTTMRIESAATADLLTLAQWLSPAFPVSGYAYSHGLEAAIAEGRVGDPDAEPAACIPSPPAHG